MKYQIGSVTSTAVGVGVLLTAATDHATVVLDMDGEVRDGKLPLDLDGQLFLLINEKQSGLSIRQTAGNMGYPGVMAPSVSFDLVYSVIGRISIPADGLEPRVSYSYLLYPDRNLGDGDCDLSLRRLLVTALGIYPLREDQRATLYIGDADSLMGLNSLTADLWNLTVPERLWDVVVQLNVARILLEQHAPQVLEQLNMARLRLAAASGKLDAELRAAEQAVRDAESSLDKLKADQFPEREHLLGLNHRLSVWQSWN